MKRVIALVLSMALALLTGCGTTAAPPVSESEPAPVSVSEPPPPTFVEGVVLFCSIMDKYFLLMPAKEANCSWVIFLSFLYSLTIFAIAFSPKRDLTVFQPVYLFDYKRFVCRPQCIFICLVFYLS